MLQQMHANWVDLKTSIRFKATTSNTAASFSNKNPRHAASCRKSPPSSPPTVVDSCSAPATMSVKLQQTG
jgi:hypothetical protein